MADAYEATGLLYFRWVTCAKGLLEMFERGRRKRRPQRGPYNGPSEFLDNGRLRSAGWQGPVPGGQPPGGPDVDQYMYRSVLGMVGKTGERDSSKSLQFDADFEAGAGPDSALLRIEIPVTRAEQLRRLARDLDESPQTLARLWVMERLREIGAGQPRDAGSGPNGSHEQASPAMLTDATATPPPESPNVVAQAKQRLGKAYITDPEEEAVFAETHAFRQWGPYIASLVLTSRGRKLFGLEDMVQILRDELMPEAYNLPGALESELTLRDADIGRPGDQMRPFACIERVAPGVYSFIGFQRARVLRAGR
jgi:hypothetical protein